MFSPFARLLIGLLHGKAAALEEVCFDNIVRVGLFAAHIKHAENFIARVPVSHTGFDHAAAISYGCEQFHAFLRWQVFERFGKQGRVAVHFELALTVGRLFGGLKRFARLLEVFTKIGRIDMVQEETPFGILAEHGAHCVANEGVDRRL